MRKRLLYIVLGATLVSAVGTGLTLPASADTGTGPVTVPGVTVPTSTPVTNIQIPTVTVPTVPTPTVPTVPGAPTVPGTGTGSGSGSGGGNSGSGSGSGSGGGGSTQTGTSPTGTQPGSTGTTQSPTSTTPGSRQKGGRSGSKNPTLNVHLSPQRNKHKRAQSNNPSANQPLYQSNGAPSPSNPTFVDALPPPLEVTAVPNFVISQFHVPPFLLPIYQAAGIQYGIRWEILAAINEIETDYGRNLSVSSAGAVGWMQFLPSTWKTWGVDGNGDGRKDPYNPVDAIFAAARYLKAAGGDSNLRRAIFAYNHAGWYVDSVMLRARLIAGVPPDVINSLTGLTDGRFPVYAHARYADDIQIAKSGKKISTGQNAAQLINSSAKRTGINIFADPGSPVIAVNDGVIKKMGTSKQLGRYIVLQDVYGNQYTYSQLGSVSHVYPVPKNSIKPPKNVATAISANGTTGSKGASASQVSQALPKPIAPATAGLQRSSTPSNHTAKSGVKHVVQSKKVAPAEAPAPPAVTKERLFANPARPNSKAAGGLDQIFNSKATAAGFSTFQNYFSRALGLNAKNSTLRRLHVGSQVISGTILGRVGRSGSDAPHMFFQIRPTGKGAPLIDPKPILDGWKLLEATAVYRASGKNALYSKNGDNLSIGQVLLLPKQQLERRVLSDPRVSIYPCGRQDIQTGQIDRRVLATLEYLADSGLNPTVSALKCGHSYYTTSGNVSEHSSGNAVDISQINGIPIAGHQDRGGIAEITVRRLMQLQGTMMPHQIISLLDLGANTLALPDHWDHIHVGFYPLFGNNAKAGKEAMMILKPGQWNDLIDRLRQINNPIVPTKPSKYAIPVSPSGKRSGSGD